MRKIVAFIICLTFHTSFSQKNVINASGIIGNLGIQYERSLNPHFSLVGQVGYSTARIFINKKDYLSTGLGYYFEGRYYFTKKYGLMDGFHIGPYYNSIITKSKELNDAKSTITSLGLTAGYQWQTDSGLAIGLIFGGGSYNFKSEIDNAEGFFDFLKFTPNLGLTFGYNF